MNLFAKILADVIFNYVTVEHQLDAEKRLIVPAPTGSIGRVLQEILAERLPYTIPTYLVIDPANDDTSEENKKLAPEGVASVRIGTCIFIVQPGNMSRINESVRRASDTSFRDDWPWSVVNELPAFSFKGIMSRLVLEGEWANTEIEQNLIAKLLVEEIVPSLADAPNKHDLLFGEIIERFDANRDCKIPKGVPRFLFHVGIPNVDDELQSDGIKDLKKSCTDISKILESSSRRGLLESLENEQDRQLIGLIYDGIGSDVIDGLGILSLRKALKDLEDSDWMSLSVVRLQSLLKITPKKADYQLNIAFNDIDSHKTDPIYISPKEDDLVAGQDANFNIRCDWILADPTIFDPQSLSPEFKLVFIIGRNVFHTYRIDCSEGLKGSKNFQFNVSDDEIFGKFDGGKFKKISVCLLVNDEEIFRRKITIHKLDSEVTDALVIEEPFNIFYVEKQSNPEDTVSIIMPNSSKIVLVSIDKKDVMELAGNENILALMSSGNSVISKATIDSVDTHNHEYGKVELVADFKNNNIIAINLISADSPKGYYSIEQAFLEELISFKPRFKSIFDLFAGESIESSSLLGALTEKNNNRVALSKRMEKNKGYAPIIIGPSGPHNYSLITSQYVVMADNIKVMEQGFSPNNECEVTHLLGQYEKARGSLIGFYRAHFGDEIDLSKHPIYARVPTFINSKSADIEPLIERYLEAYSKILEELSKHQLSRNSEIILTYLDCVVMLDNVMSGGEVEEHQLFLIGPWHPLQVVGRYQRQRMKFHAGVHCHKKANPVIHKLSGVLEDLPGPRALYGFSGHNNFVDAYVSDTSDLDWSVALKTTNDQLDFGKYASNVAQIFDLTICSIPQSTVSATKTYITDFLRANPAERRLEIYIRNGIKCSNILTSVADLLYRDQTVFGRQLTGGVHLYFESLLDEDLDEIEWNEPPICIYEADEETCLKENHIDILLLAPEQGFKKRVIDKSDYRKMPRGSGCSEGMILALPELKEGGVKASSVYQEVSYVEPDFTDPLSALKIRVNSNLIPKITKLGGFEIERSVKLPKRVAASWIIIPGNVANPAMLSHYVNSEGDLGTQKVLWDYKVDLTSRDSDCYTLSDIADGLAPAISTTIFKDFDTKKIVRDLSIVGIAIGGESLKSGTKALGIIGQIGAVRMFSSDTEMVPLSSSPKSAGLILPVDSFDSILGSSSPLNINNNEKSDLLAIQLSLDVTSGALSISGASIEVKWTSTRFKTADEAFKQARQTFERFKILIDGALQDDGVIERMLLGKLIRYGLQLKYDIDVPANMRTERDCEIIDAILKGAFIWREPTHSIILCSTEGELPDTKCTTTQDGLWVQLSPKAWPGEHDSASSLKQVRSKLKDLFGTDSAIIQRSDVAGTTEAASITEPVDDGLGSQNDGVLESEFVIEQGVSGSVIDNNIPNVSISYKVGSDLDVTTASDVYFGPSNTALTQLNVGIVGDLGTGKTQAMTALLYNLVKQKQDGDLLPPRFLALDYKGEDKGFCTPAFIKATSARVIKGRRIPLNLFDIHGDENPDDSKISEISGFAFSTFKKLYSGLGAVQEMNFRNAIKESYRHAIAAGRRAPTIYDVKNNYHDQVKGKPDTLLNVLTNYVDQDIFEKDDNKITSLKELLTGNVVVDLGVVSDIPRKMIIACILNLYYDYMKSLPSRGYHNVSGEQHRIVDSVLVIDEAHNIMPLKFNILSTILLEGREYGVGVWLASQYLSHFKQKDIDYLEPLKTWFILQVPNATRPEIERLGFTNVHQNFTQRVKTQERHQCLYKDRDGSGKFIKLVSFFELMIPD